jgi:hypothetical protein
MQHMVDLLTLEQAARLLAHKTINGKYQTKMVNFNNSIREHRSSP